MSSSLKSKKVVVLESEKTIHDLMQEYELPLSVRKKSWFGHFYFQVEAVNGSMVSGTRYKNGRVYDHWTCSQHEYFFLYDNLTAIHKANTVSPVAKNTAQATDVQNPNNLSLDKANYIKGETRLFVQKDAKLLVAIFDRFEVKNGREVIYVICEGKEGFYPFPNTSYVFPNKDDGKYAVDKKNRMYQDNTETTQIIRAFSKLPNACVPSVEKSTELEHEVHVHQKVNTKLLTDGEHLLHHMEAANDAIAATKDDFRNACIEARETGYRDAHTFISIDISAVAAEREALSAQREYSRIEDIRRKPYFARVDCGQSIKELHTAYLGEHEIPGYVVDWRHPDIGNAYYLSGILQSKDDIVIALKRVVDIENATFRGYEDELNLYHSADFKVSDKALANTTDDLLTKLLTLSREDKTTHDIIKTIQGEQYDIITSDFYRNAVINGCAGSGKTMIMYHRLSYIAYNHMMRTGKAFNPESVYVISPSEIFDSCNNALLQKLSIDTIHHAPLRTHLEALVYRYCAEKDVFPAMVPLYEEISDKDQPAYDFYNWDTYNQFVELAERIETDPQLSEKYRKWILYIVRTRLAKVDFTIPDTEDVSVLIRAVMRLYQYDCFLKSPNLKEKLERKEERDSVQQSLKFFEDDEDEPLYYGKFSFTGFSYENLIASLKQLNPTSSTYRSREKRIIANRSLLIMCLSGNTKRMSDGNATPIDSEFWRILDNSVVFEKMTTLIIAEKLLRTLDKSNRAQDDYLLKCAFAYYLTIPKQHFEKAYLYYLRVLSQRYGAIVKDDAFVFVDEFQNYSVFEFECLKGAFARPIFNLYGDFDQRIDEKGATLQSKLGSLFVPQMYNINVNYRNAKQITEYINRCVHKNMQPIGVTGTVKECKYRECDFIKKDRTAIIAKDLELAKRLLTLRLGKTIINVASDDKKLDSSKITLLEVVESKGLEFDSVYVFSAGMTENEKYVAYTRALSSLTIVTDTDLEKILEEEECAKKATAKKQQSLHEKAVTTSATPQLQAKHELTEAEKGDLYWDAIQRFTSEDLVELSHAISMLESISPWRDTESKIDTFKKRIKAVGADIRRASYREKHLCQHCGGKFTGLFSKACKSCGKPKDY